MWNKPQLMMAVSELLMFLAGVMLFIAAAIWCARLPFFPIQEVVVSKELQKVEYDDLQEAISGRLNGNFFSIDINALRASLEEVPWIRHAEVRRQWPGKIEIDIEEHQAVAQWGQSAGQWVNSYGEIFMASSEKVPLTAMPVFLGPVNMSSEMLDFYHRAQSMLKKIGRSSNTLSVSQRLALQIKLDDGMLVELGRQQHKVTIEERLQRFVDYYPSVLGTTKSKPSAVDMRYPSGFALRTSAKVIENKGTP